MGAGNTIATPTRATPTVVPRMPNVPTPGAGAIAAPRAVAGDDFSASGQATPYQQFAAPGASAINATARTDPRAAILDDMTRGMQPPPDARMRERMLGAMGSFSTDQLGRMRDQGVRFSGPHLRDSRVLEGTASSRPMQSPGRYLAESRTVQLRPNVNTGQIRHELAHAWDDVRNDRTRFDENAPTNRREDQMERLHHEDARGTARHIRSRAARVSPEVAQRQLQMARQIDQVAGRRGRVATLSDSNHRYQPNRLTMTEMHGRYLERVGGRRQLNSFDSSAREGHSMSNPREFYAEGFNTFHGNNATARERMQRFAPELYQVLRHEARANGTLPDGVE